MTAKDDGAGQRVSSAPDATAGRKSSGPPRAPIAPTELAGFGVQFVVSVLVFLYAGRWLDARLHTSPWLLLLGTFVGAGAAFFSLYRKLTGPSR